MPIELPKNPRRRDPGGRDRAARGPRGRCDRDRAAGTTGTTAPARRAAEEPAAALPTLQALQGWRPALRGRVEAQEPSLRERALRETALQVGSQAALAQKTRAQNAEVEAHAKWLDEIYRFDQLLSEKGWCCPRS